MKTTTDKDRIRQLEAAIKMVLAGLAGGSIKAKPLMDTSNPEAESWPTYSMTEFLSATLENREPVDQR